MTPRLPLPLALALPLPSAPAPPLCKTQLLVGLQIKTFQNPHGV